MFLDHPPELEWSFYFKDEELGMALLDLVFFLY